MSLSIIIPTSGDLKRLNIVMEGWSHQSDSDFDLHLVQDGGEPDLLASLVANYKRKIASLHFHYLEPTEQKVRISAARNLGLKHVTGDRTLVTDQDCLPALNLVQAHKGYGTRNLIVVGLRRGIPQERFLNLPVNKWEQIYQWSSDLGWRERRKEFRDRFNREIDSGAEWCEGSHCSFPTQALRDVGGYWEAFTGWGCEDVEIAYRLIRYGLKVYIHPKLVTYHLDHLKLPRNWESDRLLKATISDPGIIVRNGEDLGVIEQDD